MQDEAEAAAELRQNVYLGASGVEALAEAQSRLGGSRSAAVQRALAILVVLLRARTAGERVILRGEAGEREVVLL